MKVKRGDVVLIHYPFASGGGGKVRPALVVQCDRNNARLDNTIIVQITSRIRFAHSEPTQILIEAASDTGQQAGLLVDSAISCENIYTVRQSDAVRKIGELPDVIMRKVNGCLKTSLEIT
jgi:mRNA-degrading endonuclease toxin of MazEF toxin-antitoxin module